MKYTKFLAVFILLAVSGSAQTLLPARPVVDTLTSKVFWGRGYTKRGMQNVADYLANRYAQLGLIPLKRPSYHQQFTYPVNTFPGEMQLSLNGKKLIPGLDFIVGAESSGFNGTILLEQQDSLHFINREKKVLVEFKDKLTWTVSTSAAGYTIVYVDRKRVPFTPSEATLHIENKLVNSFKASNVCGMVRGTELPDSLLVITAHYDHLGGMGSETYFAGANDNASGVAVLLSLADYYVRNPARYSVVFICFAGEEAGLIGSKYFTEHPLVDLKSIKFLTNIDLAGTGSEGITVVNATEFASAFDALKKINERDRLLTTINARGKAANSDHYYFTEKGVPSFFIYTLGGIKAYHDIFDVSSTLPLNETDDLAKLIIQFYDEFDGGVQMR